ncbi:hypothetical protein [Acinetobacter gerneri]|uniref:hypothetical protein n=1 Tax=Acinetobacter gerneri TaxID=202952 RepID=UPI0028AD71BD|nr:hypothetical protein [Acinetobacter gerneri]
MRSKITGLITGLFVSTSCLAVNVGDITSIINADKNFLAKEIENTTEVARFVGLKVYRLSSPMSL